jgi:hypothetical protein
MYDKSPALGGSERRGQVPPPFRCSQITSPLYILYGGHDNLCDIPYLLEQTRSTTEQVMEIETYDHLSFLWADDVRTRVNNHVLDIVNESTGSNTNMAKVPQSPQIIRAEKDGIRMWKVSLIFTSSVIPAKIQFRILPRKQCSLIETYSLVLLLHSTIPREMLATPMSVQSEIKVAPTERLILQGKGILFARGPSWVI